jgi:hypothetical protein
VHRGGFRGRSADGPVKAALSTRRNPFCHELRVLARHSHRSVYIPELFRRADMSVGSSATWVGLAACLLVATVHAQTPTPSTPSPGAQAPPAPSTPQQTPGALPQPAPGSPASPSQTPTSPGAQPQSPASATPGSAPTQSQAPAPTQSQTPAPTQSQTPAPTSATSESGTNATPGTAPNPNTTVAPGANTQGTPPGVQPPPAQLPAQPGAGGAQAQPAQPAAGGAPAQWPDFSQVDANGDGFVNRDEARPHPFLGSRWTEFDTDQSGSIDSAEYIRARSLRNDQ